MSLSPAIIDAMVASGCTVEQMAAVMKAALAGEEQRVADKRAKDAERQRRHRASRDVTVTECDSADSVTEPLSPAPNENNSNPHPHTPETHTPRERLDPFPMPEWCPSRQVWADLKANRKAKRLPNTPTAHAKLLRDIDSLSDDEWPPGRLLEAIVARGWAAAHDPRETRKPGNGQHPNNESRGGSTRSAAQIALERLHHS
jgi:hypothetical protein